jgi:hypothetical protein
MWWEARNKVNAGDKKQTAYEVSRSVMSMAHLMNHPVADSKNSTNSLLGWSPPPDSLLKINTDGAFVKETGVGAWGFIIRDSAGHAVIAGAGNAGLIYDALMAEALACVTALEAASMNGISRVQLEVDASELRSAIVSTTSDRSVCGMIFSDIRSLLYESFVCSKVSLIPRRVNSSAHELAKSSSSVLAKDVLVGERKRENRCITLEGRCYPSTCRHLWQN